MRPFRSLNHCHDDNSQGSDLVRDSGSRRSRQRFSLPVKTQLLTTLFLTFCLLRSQAAPADESAASRVEMFLKNWKTVAPDFLNNPANRDLIPVVREAANKGADDRARLLLLKAGDAGTIQLCLDEMRREGTYSQVAAARVLGASGQPGLIRFLAEDLNKDEPAKSKRISAGEEVLRITPISVLATNAILALIMQAPAFHGPTKAWATSFGPASENPAHREKARNSVRLWWKQNEAAIIAEDYSRVQPPRS